MGVDNMMPVPTHLEKIIVPFSGEAGLLFMGPILYPYQEETLVGNVICSCGNDELEVLYPGQTHIWKGERIPCVAKINENYFLIVKVRCSKCKAEHLIFDRDFHGWNGWVCRDTAQASLPRPELTEWNCSKCENTNHKVVVVITTQGKDDFLNETEGQFDVNRWQDAFESLSVTITCLSCGHETKSFIVCEAM